MASVIWISPPLPFFCFFNLLKINFGKMYLPITALFDGALFAEGFSKTFLIMKLFLLILFFNSDSVQNHSNSYSLQEFKTNSFISRKQNFYKNSL